MLNFLNLFLQTRKYKFLEGMQIRKSLNTHSIISFKIKGLSFFKLRPFKKNIK